MNIYHLILDRKMPIKKSCWPSLALACLLSACSSNQLAPVREAVFVPVLTHEPTWTNGKAHTPIQHPNDISDHNPNHLPNNNKNSEIPAPIVTPVKPFEPPTAKVQLPNKIYRIASNFDGFICKDAPVHIGKSLGNGECVDLVKLCSNAPLTRYWKPGKKVFGNDLPPGTAIATFRKGKYPNKSGYHAAIYSHQDENGIYAWDQWQGQAVHLRYIKARQSHKKAGNNASKYRVIRS